MKLDKLPFDYRLLIIIPAVVFLFAVGVLVNHYLTTGEWFQRSIDLKGGTVVTVSTGSGLDLAAIENLIKEKFGDVEVRESRSFEGYTTLIKVSEAVDSDKVVEALASIGVDTSAVSVETVGPALGESFWFQAQLAMVVAFVLMSIIVFLIFRTPVPSLAVIMSAAADIIGAIGFMQVFRIEFSLASLAAVMMLIGYSVDTDILLTSRLLRGTEEGTSTKKIRRAFKTGLTMTMTSFGALTALYVSSISIVISQIAAVLLIGLALDIMNTWLLNAVVLKWYVDRRKI